MKGSNTLKNQQRLLIKESSQPGQLTVGWLAKQKRLTKRLVAVVLHAKPAINWITIRKVRREKKWLLLTNMIANDTHWISRHYKFTVYHRIHKPMIRLNLELIPLLRQLHCNLVWSILCVALLISNCCYFQTH